MVHVTRESEMAKTPEPLNAALHECLTALGYVRTYNEPEFDDGDPENGPGTWGCPGYDEYESATDRVFYDEMGGSHYEVRDLELEKWIEQNVAA
jgi:hypothetical protein